MDSDYEKLRGANLAVPLLCLSDGSDFAESACAMVRRSISGHLLPVVQCAAVAKFTEESKAQRSEGFRTKIRPLKLWDGRRPWCAWFIDIDIDAGGAAALPDFDAVEGPAADYFHAVFLRGEGTAKIADAHAKIAASKLPDGRVWALACSGKIERAVGSLGLGAGAYLAGAWLNYIDDGNAKIDHALGISDLADYSGDGIEGLWTLGIGIASPDLDYHTGRWSEQMAAGLRELWLDRADAHEPVSYPTPVEMLKRVLPDAAYSCKPYDPKQRRPDVEFPDERFQITGFPRFARSSHDRRSRKAQMIELLANIREHYQFLKGVALPNACRAISRKMMGLRQEVTGAFAASLKLQDEPRSLITNMIRRVKSGGEFADGLLAVKSTEPVRIENFNRFWNHLRSALSAVPSVPGLCLRLGLIGIGFGWLLVGPFVWKRFPTPLGHPVLNRVFWIAAGFAAVITIATAGWFWYSRKRADNRLAQAENQILLDHNSDVAEQLAKAIRDAGQALSGHASRQLEIWSALEEHFRRSAADPPPAAENRNPIFNDMCVDSLMFDAKDDLLKKIHTRVIENLPEVAGDPEVWESAMRDAVDAILTDHLKSTSFQNFVDTAQLEGHQKKDLLQAALHEASRPALRFEYHGEVRAICSALYDWREFAGMHDYTRFTPLQHHALVAIAPIAVQADALKTATTEGGSTRD